VKTAWDPSVDDADRQTPGDSCPRCARGDHREHLMQTNGVAFYRCGACGHMFIVRTSPREPDVEPQPTS
jgi:Zn ribbon nucleic-acid-binding protein